MSSLSKGSVDQLPKFPAMLGTCLGHQAYRGFGLLRDLASISKADIFDQEDNPYGTQRNLNVQHARKAYKYVTETKNAFFPEIILNIRDASYVKYVDVKIQSGVKFGILEFVKDPAKATKIVVSRLDGNHRLWFADGHEPGLDPVELPVSFCILNLSKLEDELALFRDINDNQMGMNTSHLQNITARLLGDKTLKVKAPAAYIVQRLQKDKKSPLFKTIHEGGKVRKGTTLSGLTSANLTNAIQDMLSRSAKLSQFPDVDAQYNIIRNYWSSVKKWLPEAWKQPRDYIIFRGVGLYAISYIGVDIIDRCLTKGKYQTKDMLAYLKQISDVTVFSSKEGLAYAGRAGGRKMATDLLADIAAEGEISLNKLQKMILEGS